MTVKNIDAGLDAFSVLFYMFVLILFFIPTIIYGLVYFIRINRIRAKNIRQSKLID